MTEEEIIADLKVLSSDPLRRCAMDAFLAMLATEKISEFTHMPCWDPKPAMAIIQTYIGTLHENNLS